MAYRSPGTINASRGMQEFLIYASEVTNYWFGNMMLIAIFTISLSYYLYTYGTKDFWSGVAVAGYFTFIMALFLWLMGVILGSTMAFVIGGVSLATVALWMNRKDL